MSFSNYWSMTNSILLSIVFFLFRYCGFMCNFWKRQLFWAFVLIVRIISQPRPLFCVPFIAKKRAGGEVVYITPQLHQYLCGRGWWVSVSVWVCVCVCVCVCWRGDHTILGILLIGRGRVLEPKSDWRHLWKISMLGVQILHFLWFQRGNY